MSVRFYLQRKCKVCGQWARGNVCRAHRKALRQRYQTVRDRRNAWVDAVFVLAVAAFIIMWL